ncbi:hypothetical protein HRI_004556200 [Hibiscus trionum]|uniref:WRKY domain-containing protein n=1 Tax=Hibiscus trionum TaxID=183268 RepID=A0A9W7J6D7_HIBTR|nr:hypothetical protein HRI_004556200 [Hibiscus trionum]
MENYQMFLPVSLPSNMAPNNSQLLFDNSHGDTSNGWLSGMKTDKFSQEAKVKELIGNGRFVGSETEIKPTEDLCLRFSGFVLEDPRERCGSLNRILFWISVFCVSCPIPVCENASVICLCIVVSLFSMAPEPMIQYGPSDSTNNTTTTNTQSSSPLAGDQSRVTFRSSQQGSVQISLARPQVASQGPVLAQGTSTLVPSPVAQHSSLVPVSSPVQNVSDVVQDQSFHDSNFSRVQRGGYGFRDVGAQSNDVSRQQSFVPNASYSNKGVSSPAQAYSHVFQPQSPSVPGFQSSYVLVNSLQSVVYPGASYPGASTLVFPATSGGCSSGLQQSFSPASPGFSVTGSYGHISPQGSLSAVSVAPGSTSGLVQPSSVMPAGLPPAAGQPVSRDITCEISKVQTSIPLLVQLEEVSSGHSHPGVVPSVPVPSSNVSGDVVNTSNLGGSEQVPQECAVVSPTASAGDHPCDEVPLPHTTDASLGATGCGADSGFSGGFGASPVMSADGLHDDMCNIEDSDCSTDNIGCSVPSEEDAAAQGSAETAEDVYPTSEGHDVVVPSEGFPGEASTDLVVPSAVVFGEETISPVHEEGDFPSKIVNSHPMMTRAKHGIRKPKVYQVELCSSFNADDIVEPRTIQEALSNENWKAAAQAEYNALLANNTWTLVPLPPNRRAGKKVRKPRYAFQTRSQVDILDDGYRWRKYGQKAVKNNKFPRNYYRCTHQGCNVKKQVQRLTKDETVVLTTYEGVHTHPIDKPVDNFQHILNQMQQIHTPF